MRHLYSWAGAIVMLAVCAAALRWGGRLERRVGLLVAAGWLGAFVVQRAAGEAAPVVALTVLDLTALAVLTALSWREREGWAVAAVACQGLSVGVHVLRLLSPAMSTWTYLTSLTLAGDGLLLALAWGVFGAWRRRRVGLSS